MFGKDLLPLSQADLQLDASSKQPGFQPLEQLTSGRYLGEICRLILVEAIQRKELFSGAMPKGLEVQFSFDTSICSAFEEADPSRGPEALTKAFDFPNAPTAEDIAMVRLICDAISTRSASLIATMLFSLHRLQRDNEVALPGSDSDAPIAIAFCGAVAEKHATALKKAQRVLDALVTKEAETSGRKNRLLVLEAAGDSGLLGAAVGAVMQEMKEPVRARL
jgi:hexokinase